MNTQGSFGEDQAATYLQTLGYHILARNFSTPFGELDIVAQDGKTLVFVEVKARASKAYGGPLAAVTKAKQFKISRTAIYFLKVKALKYDSIRFDVIGVLDGKIEHIKRAFFPPRTTM